MSQRIPKHVAIIMDGNGRWAKKQFLPRTAGHLQGTKNIRNIVIAANDLGIESLTLYAFSTENWKRPMDEVEFIMRLPSRFFESYIGELMEHNVRIRVLGELAQLPDYARRPIEDACMKTKQNTGLTLNLALNYGGRRELELAVQKIVASGIPASEVTSDVIGSYLMTEFTDVDLLIRTSNEYRISNFMLWQIAYSELVFVDTLWPDFDAAAFQDAIAQYQRRQRRFGGIDEK